MKIVLIGGNPKGYNVPFHPSTKSGKRLRQIIEQTGISCELTNMTNNLDDNPTREEINELKERYKRYQVIFLGRFVEKALKDAFPSGIYLPHPASRRNADLIRLTMGLADFVDQEDRED